jgi:hypothetical protein
MATCIGGAAAEKMKLGATYTDVIDARVREVMDQPNQEL